MTIFEKANYLIETIENAGFEAYQVGGCVRDFFMKRKCDDIDITTSAKPGDLEKILAENNIKYIETGLKHGTVTAVFDGDNFEITTYRTDGEYIDNRHPENVSFVSNIDEDLSRRDFTINAIAYNPNKDEIVDLFGGRDDIENKIKDMNIKYLVLSAILIEDLKRMRSALCVPFAFPQLSALKLRKIPKPHCLEIKNF